MVYMGSKRFMAGNIIEIIDTAKELFGIDTFYDLFMGGCNIIENVDIKNRIGNDLNKYLIAFIEYLRQFGTDKLPKYISRETWYKVKNNIDQYDDAVVFYVMNFGSFNNIWGQGYGGYYFDCNGRAVNKIDRAKKALTKELPKLNDFVILNKDYRDVEIKPGSIVYLDPPYKNTKRYYAINDKFNSIEFYRYAKELAKDNFVIISEYYMPDDFIQISKIYKQGRIRMNNNGSFEGIYLVKDGWGVDKYLEKITNK